nr:molybdenum cofactor cytidylyltransferase [Candidatus Cloacimonadota bacterium]
MLYKTFAIILASGKGSRFGMPKSKASFNGSLFSQKIMETLVSGGIEEIYLADDLKTDSMLDTIRQSISSLKEAADCYLIFPVDHPFVLSETISTMLQVSRANPDCVIKPEYRGHRGHPIIIPANLDLNDCQYDNLRDLIRYSGIATLIVPVEDPGILMNINHPEDIHIGQEACLEM